MCEPGNGAIIASTEGVFTHFSSALHWIDTLQNRFSNLTFNRPCRRLQSIPPVKFSIPGHIHAQNYNLRSLHFLIFVQPSLNPCPSRLVPRSHIQRTRFSGFRLCRCFIAAIGGKVVWGSDG